MTVSWDIRQNMCAASAFVAEQELHQHLWKDLTGIVLDYISICITQVKIIKKPDQDKEEEGDEEDEETPFQVSCTFEFGQLGKIELETKHKEFQFQCCKSLDFKMEAPVNLIGSRIYDILLLYNGMTNDKKMHFLEGPLTCRLVEFGSKEDEEDSHYLYDELILSFETNQGKINMRFLDYYNGCLDHTVYLRFFGKEVEWSI